MRIFDFVPEGAENAISRQDLMLATGLSDRELRHKVHLERRTGYQILTNCETSGYYRPTNPEDSMRFVRSMRHRAAETSAVADAIEASVMEEIGQTKIGGV